MFNIFCNYLQFRNFDVFREFLLKTDDIILWVGHIYLQKITHLDADNQIYVCFECLSLLLMLRQNFVLFHLTTVTSPTAMKLVTIDIRFFYCRLVPILNAILKWSWKQSKFIEFLLESRSFFFFYDCKCSHFDYVNVITIVIWDNHKKKLTFCSSNEKYTLRTFEIQR